MRQCSHRGRSINAEPKPLVEPILEGLTPFFNKHMGPVSISDVWIGWVGQQVA